MNVKIKLKIFGLKYCYIVILQYNNSKSYGRF